MYRLGVPKISGEAAIQTGDLNCKERSLYICILMLCWRRKFSSDNTCARTILALLLFVWGKARMKLRTCTVCGYILFQAAVNDVWEEWLSGIHLELQPALFRNLWLAVPSAVASKIRTLLIVCQREFSGGACR